MDRKIKGHNCRNITLGVKFVVTEEELQDAFFDVVGLYKNKWEFALHNELSNYEVVGWRKEPEWHVDNFSYEHTYTLSCRPIVRKYAPPPP